MGEFFKKHGWKVATAVATVLAGVVGVFIGRGTKSCGNVEVLEDKDRSPFIEDPDEEGDPNT